MNKELSDLHFLLELHLRGEHIPWHDIESSLEEALHYVQAEKEGSKRVQGVPPQTAEWDMPPVRTTPVKF